MKIFLQDLLSHQLTFKHFLLEQKDPQFKRPYFKATEDFIQSLTSLKNKDVQSYNKVKQALYKFKNSKTTTPGDWADNSLNDHALSRILSGYCEFHLIHGTLICLYKHHGRFIVLSDIVSHKVVENDKLAKTIKYHLDKASLLTYTQVKKKLEQYDKKFTFSKK
jgi:hypothetical protein